MSVFSSSKEAVCSSDTCKVSLPLRHVGVTPLLQNCILSADWRTKTAVVRLEQSNRV